MPSNRASTPAGRSRSAGRPARASSRSRAGHAKAPSRKPAANPKARAKPKAKPPPSRKPPKQAAAKRPAPRRKPIASGQGAKPSPARVAAIAAGLLIVFAAGYFLWLRDSGLVAVEEVAVVGMEGPESEAAAAALSEAAQAMTTLHVQREELERVAARFPTIEAIETDASLLNALEIRITERPPVLAVKTGESALPIAGDGTVLAGVEIADVKLPVLAGGEAPAGSRAEGEALAGATVAGAIPAPLLPMVAKISAADLDSIEVQLRGGIPVQFGGAERATEKWAAIAAILADPRVDRLTGIDVRVPERPALGGAAPPPEVAPTEESEPLPAPEPVEPAVP